MAFSIFTESCDHHHSHFRTFSHPKKKCHTHHIHIISDPISPQPTLPQHLETTDLLYVSMDLPTVDIHVNGSYFCDWLL